MKKIISLLLCVCTFLSLVSCSSSNTDENTNPYQVHEEITKIIEEFNSNADAIEKITVTIADNETEINVSDNLLTLFNAANSTKEQADCDLNIVLAYIKIYYSNEKVVDYGRVYTDSDANIYLVSNYNQNENAALKITDTKMAAKLIFPNNNLF